MNDLYFFISRSRLKNWLQCVFFILMVIVIYQAVALIYSIFLNISLAIALYFFIKRQKVLIEMAFLDKNIWTFKYLEGVNSKEVFSILDHQIYFVFYTGEKGKRSTTVIWKDQLTVVDYKKMRVLAKLYSYSSDSND